MTTSDSPHRLWKRLAVMVGLIVVQVTLVLGLAWLLKAFILVPLAESLPLDETVTRPVRHVLTVVMMLLLYWLVAGKLSRRRVPELALNRLLPESGAGLGVGSALMGSVLVTLWALGYLHIESTGSAWALPGIFAGILLAALWEELIFRGVLYRNIEAELGTVTAMGVSAAIFGGSHFLNPNFDIVAFSSATMGGLLVCCIYSLTGRLWAPIGFHVGWNLIQVFFGVPLSGGGDDFGVLFTSRLDGPTLLTGGQFGPESSILAIGVVTIAFLAGVRWMRVRRLLIQPSWRQETPGAPETEAAAE